MSKAKSKTPTIADVAKAANVSMMTVSRTLNSVHTVKDKTREKIEQAIQELGYKPNFSARRLSGGRNYFIGVICFQPNSAYVSQFLFGCIRQCSEIGYHLIVEEMEDSKSVDDLVQALAKDVDGVILLPPVSENLDVLHALESSEIPYVQIGQSHFIDYGPYSSSVVIDDFQAAYELTKHVIQCGHRNIGFITGDMQQQVSSLRLDGFKSALSDSQIPLKSMRIAQGDFSYKSALTAAEKLLSLKDELSAIVCSNDDMAAAAIAVAHKHQLNVPDDLSVVGFDDTTTAIMVWPHLTTIRQPLHKMAIEAVNILLNDKRGTNSKVLYEMVERDSTNRIDNAR